MNMWCRTRCLAATLLLAVALVASATDADSLIQKLSGDDERVRSEARQLFSREDVSVVPKLFPLLKDPNAAVWCAAYNVLADFASEVSVAGRERDREAMTDSLMTLLSRDESNDIKMRALRLLSLVVPEGYNVASIAALLKDPELKEKARAALEEAGTVRASQALAKAVRNAEPDFQCALLDSLGRLHDAKSVSRLVRYTKSSEPKVRASAARALSWTGEMRYLNSITSVYEAATPETAFDAGDAMIRFADAVALRRGDKATATASYEEVLETSKDESLRGAAVVGLVRHGDKTATELLVSTLCTGNGRALEPAALSAFENMNGTDANAAMLMLYSRASAETRINLLGVFGRRRDPVFLDVLKESVERGDAASCHAALVALADSQLPYAAPILASAATNTTGESRAVALGELTRLARVFADTGQSDAASDAYFGLYRSADSDTVRQLALNGMVRFPNQDSSEFLLKAIESGEFNEGSPEVLAGLAKGLLDAGKSAEAGRAATLLLAKATTPEAINEIIRIARETKAIPDLAHRLGFVTSWKLVGPFSWSPSDAFNVAHINEPSVDTTAVYQVNGKEIAWRGYDTQDDVGIVDLGSVFGAQANVTAYGIATISLPSDTDAIACMGSDDGVKLWVNGVAVHENNVNRGTHMDQDKVSVKLKAGANTLLVEVTQGGGGWNFCLRLTKSDGSPLPVMENQ